MVKKINKQKAKLQNKHANNKTKQKKLLPVKLLLNNMYCEKWYINVYIVFNLITAD